MIRILALAALLAGLAASSASAAKPIKQPIGGPTLDFAAGELCSFSVSIHTVTTKQFAITFSNGTTVTHGQFVVSVTNNDKGTSRTIDLSGAVHIDQLSDTVFRADTTGTTMSFFPVGAFGPGSPGSLILTHGRTVEVDDFATDPPLALSFQVLSGNSEDLCQTMA